MTMDPLKLLGWTEIILRLGSAVFIGALLGVNRELRGKPAGLRTNALVALGAALTTLASIGISLGAEAGQAADANAVSRAVQGIITGVGFIGAGVIIRDNSGTRSTASPPPPPSGSPPRSESSAARASGLARSWAPASHYSSS